MTEPTNLIKTEALYFTIFAARQDDYYANIFTCIRNRLDVQPFSWRKFSGKNKVVRFDACFSTSHGQEIITEMTNGSPFTFSLEDTDIQIVFGNLKRRTPVFIPNAYQNSLANGWWPGTLNHGFWLNEWYSLDANYSPHPNTIEFILKSTGFDLKKLPDFLNTILQITSLEDYIPMISYNPDYETISFVLNGNVEECDHKVSVEMWETDEMLFQTLVDMPCGTDHIALSAPFAPQRLGFDLYKRVDEDWELIASAKHYLLRQINLNFGLITGKLVVNKGDLTEEHDIVSYGSNRSVVNSIDDPWTIAENERIRLNKTNEIRKLGSIFVRNNGSVTREQLWEIIIDEIFNEANELLYIWDPYLDGSILPELLIKAISLPSLRLKLMLSEPGVRNVSIENGKENTNEVPSGYKRCFEIFTDLSEYEDKPLSNLEIRNWFRTNEPAFHDRFIITEKAVWHLGSSLKDLGNYHSTIYRFPEELARQVRQEFEQAWEGDFGVLKPYGFSIAPLFTWLRSMEGAETI